VHVSGKTKFEKKLGEKIVFKSTRIRSSVLHVSDQKKFEYAHSVYRTCSPVLQCFQDLEHIYIKTHTLSSVVHVAACARPVSRRAHLEDHAKCCLLYFFTPLFFSLCTARVQKSSYGRPREMPLTPQTTSSRTTGTFPSNSMCPGAASSFLCRSSPPFSCN